ncbi:MAG: hypothetical protein JWR26_2233 [Pedosphaera sp.]|nr:hypothetical protein [Pedosphaera sp.]
MKTKPHGESILHGLKPEQRERIDDWLFEEKVSYSELAHQCRQLREVKVPESSVRRYYERQCVARILAGAIGLGRFYLEREMGRQGVGFGLF